MLIIQQTLIIKTLTVNSYRCKSVSFLDNISTKRTVLIRLIYKHAIEPQITAY